MDSRERVVAVIRHEKPDRVPVYGWVSANLSAEISEAFGSVAAFEDRYEFDFAHLFGGPPTFAPRVLEEARRSGGGAIEPATALELPMTDPDDLRAYRDVTEQVRHHKENRGRFVYMQTPGIFEALNGVFGIENHLLYMAMHPGVLMQVYGRQAAWNIAFANNCLDLGVDMVHVSDDWGSQSSLLFSRRMWREMIFPHHARMTAAVKKRGAFVSMHSDGNVNSVIDGIAELGYDVVHPWQESAGMSLEGYRRDWSRRFAVMGGLDVQTTIGFGDYGRLSSEIERVLGMFRDGGLLYCTTHFVQNHCSIEELRFAFDLIHRTVRSRPA